MSDKRQATTGAWVSPQPVTIETRETTTPTHKGEISQWRTGVFFMLAFAVALCGAWLAFTWSGVTVALSVFVLALLLVFVPLYAWDSMLSSGFLHHKIKVALDQSVVDLETIKAVGVNEAQDAAIRQLQADVTAIKKQLANMRTIEIHDKDGSRTVSLRDDIDAAIDVWLTGKMFDTSGRLVGVHPSGVIKDKYPFSGKDDASRQANVRLGGLVKVRQPGNQYAWIGPSTLTETMDALAPLRDEYLP